MNNHVTSLELSQKLKALGVPQKSEFYWKFDNFTNAWSLVTYKPAYIPAPKIIPKDWISAFLASELGELLPGHIEFESDWLTYEQSKDSTVDDYWYVKYLGVKNKSKEIFKYGKGEVEQRGLMLVYLKEKGLV